MKAIILSAGQGRRLLPRTAHNPKCALMVGRKSVIEWQIDALLDHEIDSITVVTGYGADQVQQLLDKHYDRDQVHTVYNPLFEIADNLVSCWVARRQMTEDFILLNGDTLFEASVLRRLLNSPARPITLATNHKRSYDADDMKVSLAGTRLVRVGKRLLPDQVDGESMGITLFRHEGVGHFRAALEQAMYKPEAFKQWYLSVIDALAAAGVVWTQSMKGLQWNEIDNLADLERANMLTPCWAAPRERLPLTA